MKLLLTFAACLSAALAQYDPYGEKGNKYIAFGKRAGSGEVMPEEVPHNDEFLGGEEEEKRQPVGKPSQWFNPMGKRPGPVGFEFNPAMMGKRPAPGTGFNVSPYLAFGKRGYHRQNTMVPPGWFGKRDRIPDRMEMAHYAGFGKRFLKPQFSRFWNPQKLNEMKANRPTKKGDSEMFMSDSLIPGFQAQAVARHIGFGKRAENMVYVPLKQYDAAMTSGFGRFD